MTPRVPPRVCDHENSSEAAWLIQRGAGITLPRDDVVQGIDDDRALANTTDGALNFEALTDAQARDG